MAAADKLHNARAIIADHRLLSDEVWDRFNASPAETRWYYTEVEQIISATLRTPPLPSASCGSSAPLKPVVTTLHCYDVRWEPKRGQHVSSGDFRFDDIVRTERYFTATILPAILLHDEFAGLRRFLELVGQRAPRPRGATGVVLTTDIALPPVVAATVEIVTEFFITRDLKAASKLPTPPSEPANALDPDGPTRLDAPDLVIVVGDQLVVCEGKFFGLCNPVTLNQQLRSQRRQIELLFKSRPTLKFYRHIAILPFAFSQGKLECDTTFTWAEMRDLAREILGPSHYLTRRLVAAVAYYELFAGGPAMGAASFGGQVPLEDALDMCRKSPQGIWIGFTGGLQALQATPRPRLLARPWKWRDSAHTGNITASNWIIGQTFVPIVEKLLDGAPPPTPGPCAAQICAHQGATRRGPEPVRERDLSHLCGIQRRQGCFPERDPSTARAKMVAMARPDDPHDECHAS